MAQEQIHEDIKWLEGQLESKKQELAEKSSEHKEEREVVRDIIKEIPLPPAPSSNISSIPQDNLEEKKHQEVIEKLVETAFAEGLLAALKKAEALNNPHLLDEFHDTLADKYYQKLLDARKLS